MHSSGHSKVKKLINTVVKGGYCIGCGACSVLDNSPVRIELNEKGCFQATVINWTDVQEYDCKDILDVCPFSDESKNEDEIGKDLFSDSCLPHKEIGYYLKNYAGYVREGGFREKGSSGGMGSWLTTELIRRNLVDAVIHVKSNIPSENNSLLFEYSISYSTDEVQSGAKSKYYPVEMSHVLKILKKDNRRYAIVGIPCFIKAIRLLAQKDSAISDNIKFCIGLVCGHLKSTGFARMFAWENEIHPKDLVSIDFRKKMEGLGANRYGVELVGIKDNVKTRINQLTKDLYGSNWGHGFFKYQACDYCDDVVAELADVTIGDAWLPQYIKDSQGTNLIIVRNTIIQNIIDEGISSECICVDEISTENIVESQAGGFRHRRDGLAHRIFLKESRKEWCPPKRVKARTEHLTNKQKGIYELRMQLANTSHIAFLDALQNDSFNSFVSTMSALISQYNKLYLNSWSRLKQRIKKILFLIPSRISSLKRK